MSTTPPNPSLPHPGSPAGPIAGASDERVRFLVEAGYMALCTGDAAGACTIFEGVIGVLPAHHAGHVGRAEALLDLGRLDDALASAKDSMRGDGHVAATLAWTALVVGKIALRMNDRAEARRMYEHALTIDPAGPASRLAAGWIAVMDDHAGTRAAIASARLPGGVR